MNARTLTAVVLAVILIAVIPAGASPTSEGSGSTARSSGIDAPVQFINISETVGLTGIRSGNNWAWGDYDNDGDEDLLILGTVLFRNNGQPRWDFTNVSSQAGIYNETPLWASWGDYDNDGWLDFFGGDIRDPGVDHLWHNDGDGTFTDVTEAAGHVTDTYPSHSCAWGDYDLDGYLDLYVCNWATNQTIYYPDRMWHNNGDGTFTDATVSSGADETANPAGTMGCCWGDYNTDGWPDIYVGQYFLKANYLYENRNGHFTNVATVKGVEGHATDRMGNTYYGHSPGGFFVDIDNDLNLDIYCSNNAHRDLYRAGICDSSYFFHNNGPTSGYNFTDIFTSCGVPFYPAGGNEELYFGENFADWDNDGDQDMFLPLVHDDIDYAYSYMMRNNGNNTFTDTSNETGLRVWNTVASAFCDYDLDGDMDMMAEGKVPYQNGTYMQRLFQNQGNGNHWVGFKLKGTRINDEAIGARITITTETGKQQMREVQSSAGTHAQGNSLIQHFGLSENTGKVDVTIRWSPWHTQTLSGLDIDRVHYITEPGRSADLEVVSIVNPPSVEAGKSAKFDVEVRNAGDVAVTSYVLNLHAGSANGTIIDTQRITSQLAAGTNTTHSFLYSPSKEGEHVIYVTVDAVHPRDPVPANNQGRASIKATKPAPVNNPPTISSFTATKTEVKPNEAVSLVVEAKDPDGDALTYDYTSNGGNIVSYGNGAKWTAPPKEGQFQITVAVNDGHGHTAHSSVYINVKSPQTPGTNNTLPPDVQNHAPRISWMRFTPETPSNNGTALLTISVRATDEDGTSDLDRAVFDLRELGRTAGVAVSDDSDGDADGVFTYKMTIPVGFEPGPKSVSVEVFDKAEARARTSTVIGISGHKTTKPVTAEKPWYDPTKYELGLNMPCLGGLLVVLMLVAVAIIARRR